MAAPSAGSSTTEEEIPVPKDLKFDTIVVDLSFHPQKDVIACADIDGELAL